MIRLLGDNRAFENHDRHGPFLIQRDMHVEPPSSNAAFVRPDGFAIELQDSCDAWYFFQISDNLAIGAELSWRGYDPTFIASGYPKQKHPGPIAIWDTHTGQRIRTLNGFHYGELRGAQLTSDGQLITWARDFLVHIWDIDTGQNIGTVPLPATLDQQNIPIVSSRIFTDWTDDQRRQYIEEKNSLSFCITLMVQGKASPRTEKYGPYKIPRPTAIGYEKYTFPHDQTVHRIPSPFRELEDIEAGYSSSFVLNDGRLVIGGTTYGAKDHVYVWDGGLNLTILLSSLCYDCNFEIDGEIRPGVVQLSTLDTRDGVMTFELGP